MTPSTTTGVTWRLDVFGRVKIHLGTIRDTLVLSICLSVLYRNPLVRPLYDGQSTCDVTAR